MTPPEGVKQQQQQQQGSKPGRAPRKRAKRSGGAAAAAAAAATAAGAVEEEPPDSSSPKFAAFTAEFGPYEYLLAAVAQHFKLQPFLGEEFADKGWAAALCAAVAYDADIYEGCMSLVRVSTATIFWPGGGASMFASGTTIRIGEHR